MQSQQLNYTNNSEFSNEQITTNNTRSTTVAKQLDIDIALMAAAQYNQHISRSSNSYMRHNNFNNNLMLAVAGTTTSPLSQQSQQDVANSIYSQEQQSQQVSNVVAEVAARVATTGTSYYNL